MSAYRLQKNLKGAWKERSEEEVRQALNRYSDKGTARDFVPSRILYRSYRKWKQVINTGIPTLNPIQFGIALRRIFANVKHVMRTWSKDRERGFSHMLGPWSRKTKLRNGHIETPTPAAPLYRPKPCRYPEDRDDAAIMARGS